MKLAGPAFKGIAGLFTDALAVKSQASLRPPALAPQVKRDPLDFGRTVAVNATVAWLLTTAAFWFLSNLASNAIEASVQKYWTRVVVMAAAGTAIGALASAVGYGFFLLALLLFMQLWFVRRKLRSAMGGNRSVAAKYAFPALLLVVFATAGSYLFSIEACDVVGDGCKRIFFERLYTPPHLRLPTG